MKKNISINISGIIFHIEEDGYENLQRYLDSINNYFSSYEESEEIIADIEGRIAEIFLEKLSDGQQVVSAEDVSELITTMGNTSDFEAMEEDTDFTAEAPKAQTADNTESTSNEEQKRAQQQRKQQHTHQSHKKSNGLHRDLNNQILGGVCSGLAHYLKVDSIWIRVAFLLLLGAGGISLIAYFVFWIAVPGSNTLEEHESVKKLYRNPDDRVLGGVCSGLSKYLNIDVIVVRIVFIIFLIGGGLSLILYLIIWAITPVASTLTAKMQMKGEKVTLSNIDENIKRQKTEEDFGPKDEGAFTKIILFPFRLIGKVLSGLSKALAPLMLFIVAVIRIFTGFIISSVGLSLMFALLAIAGVVFGLYSGDEWYYIDGDLSHVPYEVLTETVSLASIIALIIVLFIPFLYLFIAGITVIAKRKIMSSSFGWSLLGIWLIALLAMATTLPRVFRDFEDESSITSTETLDVGEGTLILDIDDRYNYHHYRDFYMIDLNIRSAGDGPVALESRIRARGRTERAAEDHARMVDYRYAVQDSVITFEDMFELKPNGEYRAQELEMTLYIPEGRPFRVKRGMEDLIGRFGRGYRWSTAYRNTWVFTESGLECLTCSDRRDDRNGNASIGGALTTDDDFRKSYNVDNVKSLDIKDEFRVYIEQGDNERISIESKNRRVDQVSMTNIGGEFSLRAPGMSSRHTRDVDIYITVRDLDKLIVSDEVDLEITGFDTEELEIRVRDKARVKFEGTATSMEATLENSGRLFLDGNLGELVSEMRSDSRLFATDAEIKRAVLTTYSSSWARIRVTENFKVDAQGRSTIRYEGDPEVDITRKSNSATVDPF